MRIPPEELAAAIAAALRALPPTARRRGVDTARLGAGGWLLLLGGAFAGGVAALLAGAVLGISLAGYLAAPDRSLAFAAAGLAALAGVRGVLRVRMAVRDGSWRLLAGAALDLALALCACAFAVGMRA